MKKKGLIVATIVMVLVLAVSLTTATYAWFSSQASATVDDLAISTLASEGLQIAMTNNKTKIDDIHSGELSYDQSTKWTGAQNTWGSFLGFADVEQGDWTDAVTYYDGTGTGLNYYTGTYQPAGNSAESGVTYYTFSEAFPSGASIVAVEGVDYYKKNGVNYEKVTETTTNGSGKVVADLDTSGDTTYYLISETTYAADAYKPVTATISGAEAKGFYVPTGYTSAIEPIGYEKAATNVNYFEFDMAITNVSDLYKLGMGIVITPDGANTDTTYPGMVAATRIEIEFYKGVVGATPTAGTVNSNAITQLEPYGAYKLGSNNKFTDESATGEAATNAYYGKDTHGSYKFILEEGTGQTKAGEVWFVTIRIWIEGTDNECKNFTAGTGYDVNIEFIFTEETGAELEWEEDDFTYHTGAETYTVSWS